MQLQLTASGVSPVKVEPWRLDEEGYRHEVITSLSHTRWRRGSPVEVAERHRRTMQQRKKAEEEEALIQRHSVEEEVLILLNQLDDIAADTRNERLHHRLILSEYFLNTISAAYDHYDDDNAFGRVREQSPIEMLRARAQRVTEHSITIDRQISPAAMTLLKLLKTIIDTAIERNSMISLRALLQRLPQLLLTVPALGLKFASPNPLTDRSSIAKYTVDPNQEIAEVILKAMKKIEESKGPVGTGGPMPTFTSAERHTAISLTVATAIKSGSPDLLLQTAERLLFHMSATSYGQSLIPGPKLPSVHSWLEDIENYEAAECDSDKDSSSGTLFTFGKGDHGKLGHGTCSNASLCSDVKCVDNRLLPTEVKALNGLEIVKVASLSTHSAALTKEGKLYMWGNGDKFRLGHGDSNKQHMPRVVDYFLHKPKVVDVACGLAHSLALLENRRVYAWGNGSNGRLGLGDAEDRLFPSHVITLDGADIIRLGSGASHSLAIGADGLAYGWGKNNQGQSGQANPPDVLFPNVITSLEDQQVVQVAGGWEHTLLLSSNGEVFACGGGYKDNRRADVPPVLGVNSSSYQNQTTPAKIGELEDVAYICCGWDHCMAINSSGTLYTWGAGSNGKLGHGDQDNRPIPTEVEALNGKVIVQAEAGCEHSVAVTADGELYAWGNGESGRLGNGEEKSEATPVLVANLKKNSCKAVCIAVGDKYNLVVCQKYSRPLTSASASHPSTSTTSVASSNRSVQSQKSTRGPASSQCNESLDEQPEDAKDGNHRKDMQPSTTSSKTEDDKISSSVVGLSLLHHMSRIAESYESYLQRMLPVEHPTMTADQPSSCQQGIRSQEVYSVKPTSGLFRRLCSFLQNMMTLISEKKDNRLMSQNPQTGSKSKDGMPSARANLLPSLGNKASGSTTQSDNITATGVTKPPKPNNNSEISSVTTFACIPPATSKTMLEKPQKLVHLQDGAFNFQLAALIDELVSPDSRKGSGRQEIIPTLMPASVTPLSLTESSQLTPSIKLAITVFVLRILKANVISLLKTSSPQRIANLCRLLSEKLDLDSNCASVAPTEEKADGDEKDNNFYDIFRSSCQSKEEEEEQIAVQITHLRHLLLSIISSHCNTDIDIVYFTALKHEAAILVKAGYRLFYPSKHSKRTLLTSLLFSSKSYKDAAVQNSLLQILLSHELTNRLILAYAHQDSLLTRYISDACEHSQDLALPSPTFKVQAQDPSGPIISRADLVRLLERLVISSFGFCDRESGTERAGKEGKTAFLLAVWKLSALQMHIFALSCKGRASIENTTANNSMALEDVSIAEEESSSINVVLYNYSKQLLNIAEGKIVQLCNIRKGGTRSPLKQDISMGAPQRPLPSLCNSQGNLHTIFELLILPLVNSFLVSTTDPTAVYQLTPCFVRLYVALDDWNSAIPLDISASAQHDNSIASAAELQQSLGLLLSCWIAAIVRGTSSAYQDSLESTILSSRLLSGGLLPHTATDTNAVHTPFDSLLCWKKVDVEYLWSNFMSTGSTSGSEQATLDTILKSKLDLSPLVNSLASSSMSPRASQSPRGPANPAAFPTTFSSPVTPARAVGSELMPPSPRSGGPARRGSGTPRLPNINVDSYSVQTPPRSPRSPRRSLGGKPVFASGVASGSLLEGTRQFLHDVVEGKGAGLTFWQWLWKCQEGSTIHNTYPNMIPSPSTEQQTLQVMGRSVLAVLLLINGHAVEAFNHARCGSIDSAGSAHTAPSQALLVLWRAAVRTAFLIRKAHGNQKAADNVASERILQNARFIILSVNPSLPIHLPEEPDLADINRMLKRMTKTHSTHDWDKIQRLLTALHNFRAPQDHELYRHICHLVEIHNPSTANDWPDTAIGEGFVVEKSTVDDTGGAKSEEAGDERKAHKVCAAPITAKPSMCSTCQVNSSSTLSMPELLDFLFAPVNHSVMRNIIFFRNRLAQLRSLGLELLHALLLRSKSLDAKAELLRMLPFATTRPLYNEVLFVGGENHGLEHAMTTTAILHQRGFIQASKCTWSPNHFATTPGPSADVAATSPSHKGHGDLFHVFDGLQGAQDEGLSRLSKATASVFRLAFQEMERMSSSYSDSSSVLSRRHSSFEEYLLALLQAWGIKLWHPVCVCPELMPPGLQMPTKSDAVVDTTSSFELFGTNIMDVLAILISRNGESAYPEQGTSVSASFLPNANSSQPEQSENPSKCEKETAQHKAIISSSTSGVSDKIRQCAWKVFRLLCIQIFQSDAAVAPISVASTTPQPNATSFTSAPSSGTHLSIIRRRSSFLASLQCATNSIFTVVYDELVRVHDKLSHYSHNALAYYTLLEKGGASLLLHNVATELSFMGKTSLWSLRGRAPCSLKTLHDVAGDITATTKSFVALVEEAPFTSAKLPTQQSAMAQDSEEEAIHSNALGFAVSFWLIPRRKQAFSGEITGAPMEPAESFSSLLSVVDAKGNPISDIQLAQSSLDESLTLRLDTLGSTSSSALFEGLKLETNEWHHLYMKILFVRPEDGRPEGDLAEPATARSLKIQTSLYINGIRRGDTTRDITNMIMINALDEGFHIALGREAPPTADMQNYTVSLDDLIWFDTIISANEVKELFKLETEARREAATDKANEDLSQLIFVTTAIANTKTGLSQLSMPRWSTVLLNVLQYADIWNQLEILHLLKRILPNVSPQSLVAPKPLEPLLWKGSVERRQRPSVTAVRALASGRKGAKGVFDFLSSLFSSFLFEYKKSSFSSDVSISFVDTFVQREIVAPSSASTSPASNMGRIEKKESRMRASRNTESSSRCNHLFAAEPEAIKEALLEQIKNLFRLLLISAAWTGIAQKSVIGALERSRSLVPCSGDAGGYKELEKLLVSSPLNLLTIHALGGMDGVVKLCSCVVHQDLRGTIVSVKRNPKLPSVSLKGKATQDHRSGKDENHRSRCYVEFVTGEHICAHHPRVKSFSETEFSLSEEVEIDWSLLPVQIPFLKCVETFLSFVPKLEMLLRRSRKKSKTSGGNIKVMEASYQQIVDSHEASRDSNAADAAFTAISHMRLQSKTLKALALWLRSPANASYFIDRDLLGLLMTWATKGLDTAISDVFGDSLDYRQSALSGVATLNDLLATRAWGINDLEFLSSCLWRDCRQAHTPPWWVADSITRLVPVGGEMKIDPPYFKALSEFPTVILKGVNLVSGTKVWYFEVTLLTEGLMQLGWAETSFECESGTGKGVGDTANSWAFDGFRQKKWHNSNCDDYGVKWKINDVVGCLVDLNMKEVRWFLNGKDQGLGYIGVGSDAINSEESAEGENKEDSTKARHELVTPAISLGQGQAVKLNLGDEPFFFPLPLSNTVRASAVADADGYRRTNARQEKLVGVEVSVEDDKTFQSDDPAASMHPIPMPPDYTPSPGDKGMGVVDPAVLENAPLTGRSAYSRRHGTGSARTLTINTPRSTEPTGLIIEGGVQGSSTTDRGLNAQALPDTHLSGPSGGTGDFPTDSYPFAPPSPSAENNASTARRSFRTETSPHLLSDVAGHIQFEARQDERSDSISEEVPAKVQAVDEGPGQDTLHSTASEIVQSGMEAKIVVTETSSRPGSSDLKSVEVVNIVPLPPFESHKVEEEDQLSSPARASEWHSPQRQLQQGAVSPYIGELDPEEENSQVTESRSFEKYHFETISSNDGSRVEKESRDQDTETRRSSYLPSLQQKLSPRSAVSLIETAEDALNESFFPDTPAKSEDRQNWTFKILTASSACELTTLVAIVEYALTIRYAREAVAALFSHFTLKSKALTPLKERETSFGEHLGSKGVKSDDERRLVQLSMEEDQTLFLERATIAFLEPGHRNLLLKVNQRIFEDIWSTSREDADTYSAIVIDKSRSTAIESTGSLAAAKYFLQWLTRSCANPPVSHQTVSGGKDDKSPRNYSGRDELAGQDEKEFVAKLIAYASEQYSLALAPEFQDTAWNLLDIDSTLSRPAKSAYCSHKSYSSKFRPESTPRVEFATWLLHLIFSELASSSVLLPLLGLPQSTTMDTERSEEHGLEPKLISRLVEVASSSTNVTLRTAVFSTLVVILKMLSRDIIEQGKSNAVGYKDLARQILAYVRPADFLSLFSARHIKESLTRITYSKYLQSLFQLLSMSAQLRREPEINALSTVSVQDKKYCFVLELDEIGSSTAVAVFSASEEQTQWLDSGAELSLRIAERYPFFSNSIGWRLVDSGLPFTGGQSRIVGLRPDMSYEIRLVACFESSAEAKLPGSDQVDAEAKMTENTLAALTLRTLPETSLSLDVRAMGSNLILSDTRMGVTNISNKKWNAVRATKEIVAGIHSWDVSIDKCVSKNIFIGVVDARAALDNYVGSDAHGWGFLANRAIWHNKVKLKSYGELYKEGDTVTVILDMDIGTLKFAVNGADMGIAVENLPLDNPLYPAFSLYNKDDQVTLAFKEEEQDQAVNCGALAGEMIREFADMQIYLTEEAKARNPKSPITTSDNATSQPLGSHSPVEGGSYEFLRSAFVKACWWRRGVTDRHRDARGRFLDVCTASEECRPYFLFPGDALVTPSGTFVVVGVAEEQLWTLTSNSLRGEINPWSRRSCRSIVNSCNDGTERDADVELPSTTFGHRDIMINRGSHFYNQISLVHEDGSMWTWEEFQSLNKGWTIESDRKLLGYVDKLCDFQGISPFQLPYTAIDAQAAASILKETEAEAKNIDVISDNDISIAIMRCRARFAVLRHLNHCIQNCLGFLGADFYFHHPLKCYMFLYLKHTFTAECIEHTATAVKAGDDEDGSSGLVNLAIDLNAQRGADNPSALSDSKAGIKTTADLSLLGQVSKQLMAVDPADLRVHFVSEQTYTSSSPQQRAFHVQYTLSSEASSSSPSAYKVSTKDRELFLLDPNRAYRRLLKDIILEVQSPRLPLFRSIQSDEGTPDRKEVEQRHSLQGDMKEAEVLPSLRTFNAEIREHGLNSAGESLSKGTRLVHTDIAHRAIYTINPSLRTPSEYQALYHTLGILIGVAIRTRVLLPCKFSSHFWKFLTGEQPSTDDLSELDPASFELVTLLCSLDENDISANTFEEVFKQSFVDYVNGKAEDLIVGGHDLQVTWSNRLEFAQLLYGRRLGIGEKVLEWILAGLTTVIPVKVLELLSAEDLRDLVCGPPAISVENLQAASFYGKAIPESSYTDEQVSGRMSVSDATVMPPSTVVTRFWSIIDDFSIVERKRFLQFLGHNNLNRVPKIELCLGAVGSSFPHVKRHTELSAIAAKSAPNENSEYLDSIDVGYSERCTSGEDLNGRSPDQPGALADGNTVETDDVRVVLFLPQVEDLEMLRDRFLYSMEQTEFRSTTPRDDAQSFLTM